MPFFFFFGARFFFCGWLASARTVPLLQAVAGKTGISAEFRVLQPSTPFRA